MSTLYGGKRCLDPYTEAIGAARLGHAAPWLGRTGFDCVLGPGPGVGLILMAWHDYADLDREAGHELVISGDAKGGRVALQGILPVRAYAAVPGARHDATTSFVIELADRRILAAAGPPLNKSYNVRLPDGSGYFSASQDTGPTPWTWATMLADIWAANGFLGSYPGLPHTPDGTPEGFVFHGVSSYAALNEVLGRVGCALKLDVLADAYSIERIATTNTVAENALRKLDDTRRVWDAYPAEPVRTRLPQYARVHFPIVRDAALATGATPLYTVDVAGGDTGAEAGTYVSLFDPLPALYDDAGGLTNSTALNNRATDRAADWYRQARENRLARVFSGAAGDLMPCSRLKGTSWRDYGSAPLPLVSNTGGALTSTYRHPGFSPGGLFAPVDGVRGPNEPTPFPQPPMAGIGPMPIPYPIPGRLPYPTGLPGGPGGGLGGIAGGGAFQLALLQGGLSGAGGGGNGLAPLQFALVQAAIAQLAKYPGNLSLTNVLTFLAGSSIEQGDDVTWDTDTNTLSFTGEVDFSGATVTGISGVSEASRWAYRDTSLAPTAQYYFAGHTNSNPSVASSYGLVDDTMVALPLLVARAQTASKLAVHCDVAGTGALVRLGLYTNNTNAAPRPDTLVVDGGELDLSTTGEKSATISQSLAAGLYWVVLIMDAGSGSPTVEAILKNSCWAILGWADLSTATRRIGWQVAQAYGALPSSWPTSSNTVIQSLGAPSSQAPILAVQFSA